MTQKRMRVRRSDKWWFVFALIVAALLFAYLRANAAQNSIFDANVGEPFEPNFRNFVNNAFSTVASSFSGTTAPVAPLVGNLWYNTSNNTLNVWSGSAWVGIGAGGGGGGTGCTSTGANGTLQVANGAGGCSAYGGSGPLTSHQFANQLTGGGALAGTQPQDSDLGISDNTTNNVSTAAHGFVPKAPNDVTQCLIGNGLWAPCPTCSGGGGGFTPLDSEAGQPLFSQAASLTTTEYPLYSFTIPGNTLGTVGEVVIDAGLTYTNNLSSDAPLIGIQYGSTDLTSALPIPIPVGTATPMWLSCQIKTLGVANAETARCTISVGSTGDFTMMNFSMAENSANSLTLSILYRDSATTHSTINLYDVKVLPIS